MSPAEIASVAQLRLAADIRDDLAALERLHQEIIGLLPETGDERSEWMRTLALAFEIDRYYTALESLMARSIRTLDGSLPEGGTWHLDLLRAASHSIRGGRPALLDKEAFSLLQELLKFRHLARHGYETSPELARMLEHAHRVRQAHASLAVSIASVLQWLERPTG